MKCIHDFVVWFWCSPLLPGVLYVCICIYVYIYICWYGEHIYEYTKYVSIMCVDHVDPFGIKQPTSWNNKCNFAFLPLWASRFASGKSVLSAKKHPQPLDSAMLRNLKWLNSAVWTEIFQRLVLGDIIGFSFALDLTPHTGTVACKGLYIRIPSKKYNNPGKYSWVRG